MPFALSPERDRELSEILTRYPTKMAACIPALHLCQDQHGWIDDEIVDFVSRRLDLPPSHVKGVVTFYTLFNQHPVGKHQVWVCRTLPCALRGAGDVLAQCEKKLGIKAGETTADGKVTLRTAECLASCGTAPMMQVDKDYFENLTTEQVDAILEALTTGKPLKPKPVPPTAPPSLGSLGSAGPFGGADVKASPASGSVRPPPSSALPPPTPPPRPGSVRPPPGPAVSSRPPGPGSATPPPAPKTPSARPPGAPSDATAPSAEKTSSTAPPKDEEKKSES